VATVDEPVSQNKPDQISVQSSSGATPIKVFISYAHRDEDFRLELNDHLSNLQRQGLIAGWHDRQIVPGQEWADQIDQALNEAQIILLLVSARFLASDYCHDKEMGRAIERHNVKEAVVIPIILSACDWQGTPFSKLQALPKDAKPIKSWPDRDEAWLDVVRGLRKVIDGIRRSTPSEARPSDGRAPVQATPAVQQPPAQPTAELDFRGKQKLVDALLGCDCLNTPQSRDQIIGSLTSAIQNRINRHSNARQDVLSIVNTCLQFPAGLESFLEIVGSFEGDSIPWQKVRAILKEILPGWSSE
jgi:hypothetical protein